MLWVSSCIMCLSFAIVVVFWLVLLALLTTLLLSLTGWLDVCVTNNDWLHAGVSMLPAIGIMSCLRTCCPRTILCATMGGDEARASEMMRMAGDDGMVSYYR